jgi:hypothetical protein
VPPCLSQVKSFLNAENFLSNTKSKV